MCVCVSALCGVSSRREMQAFPFYGFADTLLCCCRRCCCCYRRRLVLFSFTKNVGCDRTPGLFLPFVEQTHGGGGTHSSYANGPCKRHSRNGGLVSLTTNERPNHTGMRMAHARGPAGPFSTREPGTARASSSEERKFAGCDDETPVERTYIGNQSLIAKNTRAYAIRRSLFPVYNK